MRDQLAIAVILGLLIHPTLLRSQAPAASRTDSAAAQPPLCFRGRPLPPCDSFLLTEFGVAFNGSEERLWSWELGFMKNVGTHDAVGAAAFRIAGPGTVTGVRARYRRWLTSSVSLDLSPGVILGGDVRGFSGQAALNFGDLFALTGYAHTVRTFTYDPISGQGFPRKQFTWYAGARAGSWPGVVIGVGGPLALFALLAITCPHGCG